MGGAFKDPHDDDAHVAAPEAAASPEAATQVASGDGPASGADSGASGDGPQREEAAAGVAEGSSEANHRADLDLEDLLARAEKADEYLDLAQRTKADFENYRRRTAREAQAAQKRGLTKLALELLPALDNLDRALAHADDAPAADLATGVKLVNDDILAAFARAGIEPYSPVGERFDPQQHEAVAQIPAPGSEPGTVVDVYQCGYRLGDAVLRPARVSVAA